MTYFIECKQNNIITYPAILSNRNGPLDLTGKTVTLIIENSSKTIHHEIICTLGCTYGIETYTSEEGGITIPFTVTETSIAGPLNGEFVISNDTTTFRIPQSSDYLSIMIYPSMTHTT